MSEKGCWIIYTGRRAPAPRFPHGVVGLPGIPDRSIGGWFDGKEQAEAEAERFSSANPDRWYQAMWLEEPEMGAHV